MNYESLYCQTRILYIYSLPSLWTFSSAQRSLSLHDGSSKGGFTLPLYNLRQYGTAATPK
jgi:hypothetical protein